MLKNLVPVSIVLLWIRFASAADGPGFAPYTGRGEGRSTRSNQGGSSHATDMEVVHAPGAVVIVTCVRHEDEFVIEWLNYHLWLGFDHVYIFAQDDNPDQLRPVLAPYLAENLVTLRPWKVGNQMGALLHFLDREQVAGQTVFFTDMDEFLVLCEHATVKQLVEQYATNRMCLQFRWLNFGTSFLTNHPSRGSVLTHYHMRDLMPHTLGKIAIRSPMDLIGRRSVHHRLPSREPSPPYDAPLFSVYCSLKRAVDESRMPAITTRDAGICFRRTQ